MFNKKDWIFEGESGEQYTFQIFSKNSELPESGGIYILSYTQPRGHAAGFSVTVLSIGSSKNLRTAVAVPQDIECLKENCWNSIYLLEVEDEIEKSKILADLIGGNRQSCGQK
ncbi:hypothetical protein [Maridesulfovibrio bastinii]|uniref:hypothetical protein n=1 Tax=Maridesulfovibrio bastinii TaxID=47157 RepID=UPI0003F8BB96|nr:hypothetical protein [Maridesulfovibrio bastinii]